MITDGSGNAPDRRDAARRDRGRREGVDDRDEPRHGPNLRVLAAPAILGEPGLRALAVGIPITIFGTDFAAGATVTIGGQPATGVSVPNSGTINATSPVLAAGTVNDLVVTNTDGTSGTLVKGWVSDFVDVDRATSSTGSSRSSSPTRSPSAWAAATTAWARRRCGSRWPSSC